FRLELLEIRLAEAVGAGFRDGDFARDVEKGRRIGADTGKGVGEASEPRRLEAQLGRESSDKARRRLEPERRAVEGALLVLEQSREVHLPGRAEIVACGEAVDRSRRDGEGGPFLELGAHLRDATLKQGVGVLEL